MSMYATVCTKYGPADQVFEYRQTVDKPTISNPHQVLIANKRTSVNPADCKQRSGNLQLVVQHEFPLVLSQDFAGVVTEIGSAVTSLKVGDAVFGTTAPRNSCAAEFVVALEDECALKPAEISWDQAAASPTAYCTAWKGLFDASHANLPRYPPIEDSKSSSRILIVGASGSVGSAAVQLAVQVAKAQVMAICGSKNADYVKSLGASQVVDYKSSDYEASLKDKTFDIILDCVGGDDYYYKLYPYLDQNNKNASYITCVGPVLHGGSERITYGTILSSIRTLLPRFFGNFLPGSWNSRYIMYLSFTPKNGVIEEVAKALKDGLLDPRIDPMSPVPLKELGKAHQKVESGHSDGKVIIKIAD